MTTLFYLDVTLDLPAGTMELVLIGDGESVTGLRFGHAADHPGWLGGAQPAARGQEPLASAAAQLAEYGAGRREEFDLPLSLAGTEFQKEVWTELQSIPYGRTTTYGAVADAIGRPGRARAVGAAVGANPIGVIVPCHRVIGVTGALTGFAGGLDNKVALLAREGITAL